MGKVLYLEDAGYLRNQTVQFLTEDGFEVTSPFEDGVPSDPKEFEQKRINLEASLIALNSNRVVYSGMIDEAEKDKNKTSGLIGMYYQMRIPKTYHVLFTLGIFRNLRIILLIIGKNH